MKQPILVSLFLLFALTSSGQNFLANPSFEELNSCYEFGSKCAPEAWFRIPSGDLTVTGKAKRVPHQGKASEMFVMENRKFPIASRVYLYSKFLCPLIAGNEYVLTFYVNTLNMKSVKVEILMSEEEFISGDRNPSVNEPTIVLTEKDQLSFDKKTKWRKLQTVYKATGKENFIIIGNFSFEILHAKRKEWSNKKGDLVYFIDDISFVPKDANEMLCKNAQAAKDSLYAIDHRHTKQDAAESHKPSPQQVIDNFFEKPTFTETKDSEQTPDPSISDLPIEAKEPLGEISPDKKIMVLEVPFVAFDFDKTEIKDEYESLLDNFADEIRKFNAYKIEFVGHTDSMGSTDYNQSLSEKRAKAVYDFLRSYPYVKILPATMIGKGEREPKASNTTIEGRQANRRVEIILYRK